MKENIAHLIIQKGEPYDKGTRINLPYEEFLLGRAIGINIKYISFSSLYISKKHALISYHNNKYYITDLNSKHGTEINNSNLEKNKPFALKNGDYISLSRGMVVLLFNYPYEYIGDETVDFITNTPQEKETRQNLLKINVERREILLDGKQLYLYGKDIELLLFLYKNRKKAVSYDEIKIAIWPERLLEINNRIPDVGRDEINVLVYRLRKRLEQYGQYIITIPRYGYMLDL